MNKVVPPHPGAFTRRGCLKFFMGSAGGALLVSGGLSCGYYRAEQGDAYASWVFPGTGTRTEGMAALSAILASDPHNSQPWSLQITPSQIGLHADLSRTLGTIDNLQREMFTGLGCALENAVIAARAAASVSLTPTATVGDPLFTAIAVRHTNRGRYANVSPPVSLATALQAMVTEPGVELRLLFNETDKGICRTATVDATRAFIVDSEMSRDSNAWYRQSADDILQHRDGVTLDASANSASTRFFGKLLGRPSDATANTYWLKSTQGDQMTAPPIAPMPRKISRPIADLASRPRR